MLESCYNLEPSFYETYEFPRVDQVIWILGKSYNLLTDLDDIKNDLRSRLWFTYRKGFSAIGGTGPTTDQGWGCMLRCGQMMLGQALVMRHLGRSWLWCPAEVDPVYLNILRLFQDKKNRFYSLHQIAQMGVSERKAIGEWFGPNTVAHVLKKLAIYDEWSNLAVHVAMDSTVVLDDVRTLCKTKVRAVRQDSISDSDCLEQSSSCSTCACFASADGEPTHGLRYRGTGERPQPTNGASHCASYSGHTATCRHSSNHALLNVEFVSSGDFWRPLFLIIPLRLGLTDLNTDYLAAIKEFFMLKQCLGIIGGRPNHALYFVGVAGDDLIYLDPHMCQPAVDLDISLTEVDDSSYHSPFILKIPVANIDPSLALGLFCKTEQDFDALCNAYCKSLSRASKPPLFEVLEHRPSHWPPFEPYTGEKVPNRAEFTMLEAQYDTDEEFEILA